MITGLLLALLAATSDASVDLFFSHHRIRRLPHLAKAFAITSMGIPIFGCLLLYTGISNIDPWFWFYVSSQAVLMSIALWLYMVALANGSVAQTKPIIGLTPAFLTITTPIMTNDVVPLIGWIGVILVTLGVYGTQLPDTYSQRSILLRLIDPFREMGKHRGARCALATAVIFSITANLDRLCLERANLVVYLFVFSSLTSAMLWGLIRASHNKTDKTDPLSITQYRQTAPGGLINCVAELSHVSALLFIPVPYVIAIKRSSILISSTWAYCVRKDRTPSSLRLIGMALIIIGICLIASSPGYTPGYTLMAPVK